MEIIMQLFSSGIFYLIAQVKRASKKKFQVIHKKMIRMTCTIFKTCFLYSPYIGQLGKKFLH